MRRIHLKKYKKNKIINKIVILIILLSICIIYIFKLFNEKVLPQLMNYAEIETKKIVSSIINNSVIEEISNNINTEEIFITTKDYEGNIESIDFDTSRVNKILSRTSKVVEQNLKYLENGEVDKLNLDILSYNIDKENLKKGIIYELPSGFILNNVLLNNILPKVPIKINLIGNIFCKLNTDLESYGINNALMKVNINIEVEVKIIMPFEYDTTKISVDVPIIMKVIEGNVPSYYFDGYLDTIVNK